MTSNNPFSTDPSPDVPSALGLLGGEPTHHPEGPSTTLSRMLSALPVRTAEATARAVADLIVAALLARRFAHAEDARQALTILHPLTSRLVLLHEVEAGGIALDMEDAVLKIGLEYGGTRLLPDAIPPALAALGPMSAETVLTLTFALDRPLRDAHFDSLIARVNAGGALRVAVRVDEAGKHNGGEEGQPNADGSGNDNGTDNADGAADTTKKGGLR